MNNNLVALALLALGAYWLLFKSDIIDQVGKARK